MPYNIVPDRVKSLEQVHTSIVPPPVGGWNTKDALVSMDPQYAIEMENYFPAFGSVDLRNGYTAFASPGSVTALGNFKYGIYDRFIAAIVAGANNIIDISAGGAGTVIGTIANPLAINFQQFRDRVFISSYGSGTTVKTWTGAVFASTGFTGTNTAAGTVGAMCIYKNRIYFAQANSSVSGLPVIEYGGVDAITGAQSTLDLTSLFKFGGYINFIGSVTRAKDFSEEELFCIVSSEGEILVYQGDNPGSVTWSKVGHYYIPKALGSKSYFYLGSTLMIITSQGVIPITSVMGGNYSGTNSQIFVDDISKNIKSKFTEAFINAGVGSSVSVLWSGLNYPRGNYLLVNVPDDANGYAPYQFIMNTVTGAWCKFTGMTAGCWGLFQNRLYFACNPVIGNSKVYLADEGFFDTDYNTGAVATRTAKLRPAYNYMNAPTAIKLFTEAQIFMYESNGLDITVDADVDYANKVSTSQNVDTSKGNAYQFYNNRVGLTGIGYAGSIRFDGTVTTKQRSIQAIKVFWREGNERG